MWDIVMRVISLSGGMKRSMVWWSGISQPLIAGQQARATNETLCHYLSILLFSIDSSPRLLLFHQRAYRSTLHTYRVSHQAGSGR